MIDNFEASEPAETHMPNGSASTTLHLLFLENTARRENNRVFRAGLSQSADPLCRLETVNSEDAFFRRLAQRDADMLLLDAWQSKAKTGALIEHIHRLAPEIPLLVLVDDEQPAPGFIERGAYDCIVPGSDSAGLKRVLAHALARGRLEKSSRRQQTGYQAALLEHISAVIVATDAEGRIVSWNRGAEALYGWRAAEATGQALLGLLHPTSPHASEAEVTRQLAEKGHWQGDVIATARNGQQIYVMASIAGLRDENGNPAGTVEIHRDIQDRIRAETVLRESERFASSIFDSLTQHIAILDEHGTIIAVNEAWRTFARENGAALERVCEGANYLDVLDIDELSPDAIEAEQFKIGLLAVMHGDKNDFSMEYSCHSPDQKRWYNAAVTRFRDEGPLRFVVAHDSITRRIQVEEQLHQANNFLLMLNRIVTMTIAALNVQEVLEIACRELASAFNAPQVAAAMMNPARTELNVVAEYRTPNRPPALGATIPALNNPSIDYLRNYKIPFVSSQVSNDPAFASVRHLMNERGIASILLIPLFINDELAGSIGVDFTRTHHFTDEEIILAASVAQAISKPLENSILHQRLTEHMNHLESIVNSRTEQLSRLNQRMAAILNNASDAIVLADSDNAIENANLAFERQFGYETDGAFGKSVFHIAEPGFREKMMDAVRIARETGIDQRVQLRALRQNGEGFDADIAIARVENNESHVVCSIRDITRLKEVERIKDRFISMVSHELRTPTTSLVLSSNTLKTHYERMNEMQRQAVIDRMQRQSQVLAELIEGILDLSRIEVRTDVQRSSPIDMDKVIHLLVNEFQPALNSKSLRLETLVDGETAALYGEEIDIERIWRNLIGNAVKYTPEGGTITVRFGQVQVVAGTVGIISPTLQADFLPWQSWSGTFLVGQVEDTGHGIPPQDLQQLFTRFYRGWAAASNVPGTGLGLSLVREVLRLYSGDIHVVSQINAGSTFSFWIPIQQE